MICEINCLFCYLTPCFFLPILVGPVDISGISYSMLNLIKEATTLTLVIPTTLVIGLVFSLCLRCAQISLLSSSFALVFSSNKESGKKKGPSTLSAISAVLGGNLGTGNIAGIAVALSMGGPGALFWMWVMALIASIFKFSECYLSLKYTQHCKGQKHTVGGPLFYMQQIKGSALLTKALPIAYAISLIFAAYGVGNVVQVQSLALPLQELGFSPLAFSCIIAALSFVVMSGGLKIFHQVVSSLVPFMAMIYIVTCVGILAIHHKSLPFAFNEIFQGAFGSYKAIGSAAAGTSFSLFKSLQVGFDRGLFATDAGSGLAGILHAPVKERFRKLSLPLSQAIASLISPILVMAICTLTGLVILVSQESPFLYESTNLCVKAFSTLSESSLNTIYTFFGASAPEKSSYLGGYLVTTTLFFFAFTTILTWSRCAEETLHFYFQENKWPIFIHRTCFALIIPISTFFTVQTLWQLADLALNAMLLTNLAALFLLRSHIHTSEIDQFLTKKNR